MHVIESKANGVNEEFRKLTHERYQFVLCYEATSEERLASMHYNEMTDIEARYESLHNASLKEKILVENRWQERLETAIMKL